MFRDKLLLEIINKNVDYLIIKNPDEPCTQLSRKITFRDSGIGLDLATEYYSLSNWIDKKKIFLVIAMKSKNNHGDCRIFI